MTAKLSSTEKKECRRYFDEAAQLFNEINTPQFAEGWEEVAYKHMLAESLILQTGFDMLLKGSNKGDAQVGFTEVKEEFGKLKEKIASGPELQS